jgi:lauroyl/myristoyl acyltransferase
VVQRLLPDGVALALSVVAGRLAWLHRPTRERARAQVALALAGTHREGEVERVARRQLAESAVRATCWWRPWMFWGDEGEGIEHVHAALAEGRGALVTFPHAGSLQALARTLVGHGLTTHILAGDWVRDEAGGGYLAYKQRMVELPYPAAGDRLLYVWRGGSFDRLRALLEAGELCFMAFDTPGHMATRFLGKPAWLARGVPHLAHATGAPVIPAVVRRPRLSPVACCSEAIDPRAHATPEELMQALADHMSELVLEAPEALEPVAFQPLVWPQDAAPYRWAFDPVAQRA